MPTKSVLTSSIDIRRAINQTITGGSPMVPKNQIDPVNDAIYVVRVNHVLGLYIVDEIRTWNRAVFKFYKDILGTRRSLRDGDGCISLYEFAKRYRETILCP